MTLPAFGSVEVCPRCGFATRYTAGQRFGIKYHSGRDGDVVIRTCPRCEGTWREIPPEGQ